MRSCKGSAFAAADQNCAIGRGRLFLFLELPPHKEAPLCAQQIVNNQIVFFSFSLLQDKAHPSSFSFSSASLLGHY
jgi:hypothetical protein